MSNDNDFDFENELEESIAQLVDEETAEAEEYVRTNRIESKKRKKAEPIIEEEEDDWDEEEESTKPGIPRVVLFAVVGVLAIGIIVAAILIGNKIYNQALTDSKDNFAYYNQQGYAAYDSKDYESAVVFFEKALTYEEDAKKEITMRMFLYDCYVATNAEDKAKQTLKDVLEIDPEYTTALIYLLKGYDQTSDYENVRALYEKYKDSENADVIAMFEGYQAKAPTLLVEPGEYTTNLEIGFKNEEDVKIYYTKNGDNPVEAGTLYESEFEMGEGTITLKYYAVNVYGFKTDVLEAKYTVSYHAPEAAVVSPSSGSYETNSTKYVTISGVPIGCKAYYTTDGTTPTTGSRVYSGPIELKSGNTTVKVIVYNENGLSSSITTATYSISVVDNLSDEACQEAVWAALIKHKYCTKKNESCDGKKYELSYYSHQTIKKTPYYIYNVSIDGKKQTYYICCDANDGKVYLATKSGSDFNLTEIMDYVAPEPETTATTETTAAETTAADTTAADTTAAQETTISE